MEETLRRLTKISGVLGAGIIERDGLPVSLEGDFGVNGDLLAATCADILANAENGFGEKLGQGIPELMEFDTESGKWFMTGINPDAFLVIKSEVKVNLGLLRIEAKNIKTALSAIL